MHIYDFNSGLNISFYSQILHLGKVSHFRVFWEEFPCSAICALFCREFAFKNGNPYQLTIFCNCLSWELFPPIYPFPAKKICPGQGNFSQWTFMDIL